MKSFFTNCASSFAYASIIFLAQKIGLIIFTTVIAYHIAKAIQNLGYKTRCKSHRVKIKVDLIANQEEQMTISENHQREIREENLISNTQEQVSASNNPKRPSVSLQISTRHCNEASNNRKASGLPNMPPHYTAQNGQTSSLLCESSRITCRELSEQEPLYMW